VLIRDAVFGVLVFHLNEQQQHQFSDVIGQIDTDVAQYVAQVPESFGRCRVTLWSCSGQRLIRQLTGGVRLGAVVVGRLAISLIEQALQEISKPTVDVV
jgi:hypothetical protein